MNDDDEVQLTGRLFCYEDTGCHIHLYRIYFLNEGFSINKVSLFFCDMLILFQYRYIFSKDFLKSLFLFFQIHLLSELQRFEGSYTAGPILTPHYQSSSIHNNMGCYLNPLVFLARVLFYSWHVWFFFRVTLDSINTLLCTPVSTCPQWISTVYTADPSPTCVCSVLSLITGVHAEVAELLIIRGVRRSLASTHHAVRPSDGVITSYLGGLSASFSFAAPASFSLNKLLRWWTGLYIDVYRW